MLLCPFGRAGPGRCLPSRRLRRRRRRRFPLLLLLLLVCFAILRRVAEDEDDDEVNRDGKKIRSFVVAIDPTDRPASGLFFTGRTDRRPPDLPTDRPFDWPDGCRVGGLVRRRLLRPSAGRPVGQTTSRLARWPTRKRCRGFSADFSSVRHGPAAAPQSVGWSAG